MKKSGILRITLIIAIIITNISCDQISKKIVRKEINYYEEIQVIDHYVVLTKVENTGAFLSLGSKISRPVYNILMILLPLIVLGYAMYYLLFRNTISDILKLGICMAIGGGVGNVIDRIRFGSVTDFMHIDFVIFRTGIFNMADVSIMIGMFFILLDVYINRKKQILRYH